MLKFRGFHLHTDVATLADDVSLAGMFEFPHQQRVLEATFRARDVYSFVFKHFPTSQQSARVPDRGSQYFKGTSIGGGGQSRDGHKEPRPTRGSGARVAVVAICRKRELAEEAVWNSTASALCIVQLGQQVGGRSRMAGVAILVIDDVQVASPCARAARVSLRHHVVAFSARAEVVATVVAISIVAVVVVTVRAIVPAIYVLANFPRVTMSRDLGSPPVNALIASRRHDISYRAIFACRRAERMRRRRIVFVGILRRRGDRRGDHREPNQTHQMSFEFHIQSPLNDRYCIEGAKRRDARNLPI